MRFLISGILFGFSLLFRLDVSAQAVPNAGPIEYQTDLTRSLTEKFNREIQEKRAPDKFSIRDYREIWPKYQATLQGALLQFEARSQQRVFAILNQWVGRYNSIADSKDIDEEQKAFALYLMRRNELHSIRGVLATEFQAALGELLRTVKAPPSFEAELERDQREELIRIDPSLRDNRRERLVYYTFDYQQGRWIGASLGGDSERNHWADDMFRRVVFPVVSDGCRSELCVGLRAQDFRTLLTFVWKELVRDRVISLADGKKVVVRLMQTPKFERYRDGQPWDPFGEHRSKLLLDRTDYPGKMAFDTEP